MTEQIVMESVESYNEYLVKVPAGCLAIAEHLRNEEVHEALQIILQFSEGAMWLVDASTALQNLDVAVVLPVEKIHEFLNEINSGLEIQDYVLVADLFEYEIAPFFENCTTIEL